jgi:biotin operon repressor
MYRDDLILQGLAAGASSTATLAEHAGISTASVWRGLYRLRQAGQVFSPVRGVYRLTPSGAALLVLPDRVPPVALEPSAAAANDEPLVDPGPRVTPAGSQTGPGDRSDATEHDYAAVAPASGAITGRFGCGAIALGGVVIALGGLVLGRHLLVVLAARLAAPRASVASDEAGQPAVYVPPWSNWR